MTQITARLERGKGQLNVGVLDPDAGAELRDAGSLLSSSQLNSYAVSLFLAMNLALPTLKLDVTILDWSAPRFDRTPALAGRTQG